MLSRERRIAPKSLFKEIFHKGKFFFSPCVALRILATASPKTQFAFIVSASVAKKATERNKIKRRLRAIVYKNLSMIKEGYAVLVFFKKEALGLDFQELEKEILSIFFRAKIASSHSKG